MHQLRHLAADHGTSIGLIARAFIARGIERADDPDVIATITEEVSREKIRKGAIGRKAMANRYAERLNTKEPS